MIDFAIAVYRIIVVDPCFFHAYCLVLHWCIITFDLGLSLTRKVYLAQYDVRSLMLLHRENLIMMSLKLEDIVLNATLTNIWINGLVAPPKSLLLEVLSLLLLYHKRYRM
jgi:hypothetical protein